jgi:photosystem II stability/assembly factor-like uncharacterized protein
MKPICFSILRCGTVLLAFLASLLPPAHGALVIDPVTPATLYAAIHVRGLPGLYKSTDAGETWTELSDGEGTLGMWRLFLDPQTPTTLYAIAVHSGKNDLLKSSDGGKHWEILFSRTIEVSLLTLASDPRTPTTLYAGTNGGGMLKSTDGGHTWTRIMGDAPQSPQTKDVTEQEGIAGYSLTPVKPRIPQSRIFSIVIDPQTSTTLYAGTDEGVKKSTDGGLHWTAMNTGLHSMAPDVGPFEITVQHLVLDPLIPTTLYASADFSDGGLVKSTDGGESWTALSLGWPVRYGIDVLAIDPKTPGTLYVAVNMAGLFKSTDGGQSWAAINEGLPLYVEPSDATNLYLTDIVVDPQTPTTLYVQVYTNGDESIFKSINGGLSWNFSNLGLP